MTYVFAMVLSRTEKEQRVEEITGTLREHPAVAVFAFQKMTVKESAALRRELRKSNGRMAVVKKRLFRRVAEKLGLPADAFGIAGSIAVTWSADLLAPAKIVHGYVKEHADAKLAGGMLNGAFLTHGQIEQLALLPSPAELRGLLVGSLAAPLRGMAGVLLSTLRGLPSVLQAIADQRNTAPSA